MTTPCCSLQWICHMQTISNRAIGHFHAEDVLLRQPQAMEWWRKETTTHTESIPFYNWWNACLRATSCWETPRQQNGSSCNIFYPVDALITRNGFKAIANYVAEDWILGAFFSGVRAQPFPVHVLFFLKKYGVDALIVRLRHSALLLLGFCTMLVWILHNVGVDSAPCFCK